MHAAELRKLAADASQTVDPAAALAIWRKALVLLPEGTRQRQNVQEKIAALSRQVESGNRGAMAKRAGGAAGVLGLVLSFIGKFKFLLIGFTKLPLLAGLLLSFGAYWQRYGWQFAAGMIISIYIHELGHVAMLSRFGIAASPPMFIPGIGAIIRLRQQLPSVRDGARVGLAGPVWGAAAALACWVIWYATRSELFGALAIFGGFINLFNLTPVWQLDGSRAFEALTTRQRWIAAGVIGCAYTVSQQKLLILLLVIAGVRALQPAPRDPDGRTLFEYCWLVILLTFIAGTTALT